MTELFSCGLYKKFRGIFHAIWFILPRGLLPCSVRFLRVLTALLLWSLVLWVLFCTPPSFPRCWDAVFWCAGNELLFSCVERYWQPKQLCSWGCDLAKAGNTSPLCYLLFGEVGGVTLYAVTWCILGFLYRLFPNKIKCGLYYYGSVHH